MKQAKTVLSSYNTVQGQINIKNAYYVRITNNSNEIIIFNGDFRLSDYTIYELFAPSKELLINTSINYQALNFGDVELNVLIVVVE